MANKPTPVNGAATYVAERNGNRWSVNMYEPGKSIGTAIQMCNSFEAAEKAAERWQKKENLAVLKEANQI